MLPSFQKTLNPVFDECFEFSVTPEQLQAEAAMIVFTVMDHDVLTANDFAGEAFVALNTIPGVASTFNMNIENLDCVTQIGLPLLEMKDKSTFGLIQLMANLIYQVYFFFPQVTQFY